MHIKPGAKTVGVRPETVMGMIVADSIYTKRYKTGLVVTEVTGGEHKSGSLHYVGFAFDGRSHFSDGAKFPDLEDFVAELKEALGKEWDVVLEKTHIHFEFQPKS